MALGADRREYVVLDGLKIGRQPPPRYRRPEDRVAIRVEPIAVPGAPIQGCRYSQGDDYCLVSRRRHFLCSREVTQP